MFSKFSQKKKWILKELFFILLYYLVSAFFIIFFKLNYLISALLYLAVPSIYLSIKRPAIIKKTLIFSSFFAPPIVLIFNYLAHVSGAWYEPSVIGVRVLGVFPIDTFIWGFLYCYFIIVFYESFFDNDRNKKIFSHNTKKIFYVISVMLFIFCLTYIFNKDVLNIKYFYILFVLLFFLVPTIKILYNLPLIFDKVILQGIYFLILSIIYELTAIYNKQWHFPGKYYVGFVELFGLKFPFEEFLWLVLAVPAVISVYEYYVDDRK